MKPIQKLLKIVVSLLTLFGVTISAFPVMAAVSVDSLNTVPVVLNLLSSLGESGD